MIKQTAFAGGLRPMFIPLGRLNLGNFGQAGENAFSVDVAQSAFDIVLFIKCGVNRTAFSAEVRELQNILSHFGKRIERHMQLSFTNLSFCRIIYYNRL
jgi:hypothetical protein